MGIINNGDGNGYVLECDDCGDEAGAYGFPGDALADAKRFGWELSGDDDGVTYRDAVCKACKE